MARVPHIPQSDDERQRLQNLPEVTEESGGILQYPNTLITPGQLPLLQAQLGNKRVQRLLQARQEMPVQREGEGEPAHDPRDSILAFRAAVTKPLVFERKNDNPDEGRVQARVDIFALFSGRYFDPGDFEYRQFIKGHVELWDSGSDRTISLDNTFVHLPAGQLTADWEEDGDTSVGEGKAGYHYGHRDYDPSGAGAARDTYYTDRPTGSVYMGHDYPELFRVPATAGDAGDEVIWDVHFKGEIRYKGKVIATRFWDLEGIVAIPDYSVNRAEADEA